MNLFWGYPVPVLMSFKLILYPGELTDLWQLIMVISFMLMKFYCSSVLPSIWMWMLNWEHTHLTLWLPFHFELFSIVLFFIRMNWVQLQLQFKALVRVYYYTPNGMPLKWICNDVIVYSPFNEKAMEIETFLSGFHSLPPSLWLLLLLLLVNDVDFIAHFSCRYFFLNPQLQLLQVLK